MARFVVFAAVNVKTTVFMNVTFRAVVII